MANPTTNYGFVLPTSTDLVTDLPADFDVALQGVDTRLKALQPGTTLGDLAYSSATANTNTRLAIGSTGNVLTVAGGVPAWVAPATPAAPAFVGSQLFSAATQTISNNTFTAVQFAAVDYIDTDNFHNPSTNNSRMTIPSGRAGKYFLSAGAIFGVSTNQFRGMFYLNGSVFNEFRFMTNDRDTAIQYAIMDLAVGDYVEFFVLQNSGGNADIWGTTALSGTRGTQFGIQFLGA